MSNFTPGPWTVEQDEEFDWKYTIRGPYPEIPNATYALLKTLGNGNNNEANARLAAAAPEMYKLLLKAEEELGSAVNNYDMSDDDARDAIRVCNKIYAVWRRIEGKEEKSE